jgi:hypothetical protein
MLRIMIEHAWERYAPSERYKRLLWKSKAHLKSAWDFDKEYPKSFPTNTVYTLSEIRSWFSTRSFGSLPPESLPSPKLPKSLTELLPEKSVKAFWETYNAGTFEDAIRRASPANHEETEKSWKVFQGIKRAMDATYLANTLGLEVLRKPKVSILHRGLQDIAGDADIGDMDEKGFAEFLDDLCPCGLKTHKEAIRKMLSRSEQVRFAKR